MIRAAVYLMFFLSGATALVYQVAWSRRLILVLGSTVQAVSLILAAWMLGLALGARLAGRRADRTGRPLLLYGILEACLAVLVVLFPVLLDLARDLSLAAGGSRPVAFLASFAVLLLPTMLMGATLPVLSRFVVRSLAGMGGRIGLLYGLNTLGAVIGTFLAGFFLVRELGVDGSTYAAAALNLLIGIAAIALGLLPRPGSPRMEPGPEPESAEGPSVAWLVFLLAFSSGLVSLASEVLWTRMLVFFLEGFTYTFSAMLTTFLLGLSLGALLSGLLVDRLTSLKRYVGWLFVAVGVVSAGVCYAMAHHFQITNWAKEVTAWISESDPGNWRTHHAASLFVASFVVLFPPALVMGGIFPAVARLATRHVGEVGARIGRIYAVNTLGAVVGSLLAGLVLTRVVGMAWGAVLVAAFGLLVGLVALGRKRALIATPVVLLAAGVVALADPTVPFVRHSHVFQGERGLERVLVSYKEGPYAAVSVVEDVRNGVKAIYTDEFQAAATGPQYRYMRLLAHLPLLLAPERDGGEVLVVCFGTGTTAGSASVHPIGGLDIVEISPEVLDLADYFRHANKGVLDEDPDRGFPVRVHVDDGRNFLARSRRDWDVITLEPLMPYTPGAVNLYTEDFYRICRERLRERGLMCQWIPIHAMSSDDYLMLLRSFVSVFPESTLWLVEGTSMVIGSVDPVPLSYARVRDRMKAPGVGEDLEEVGFTDPDLVLNAFVTSGEDLRAFVENAKRMTDEHPLMEFRPLPIKFPNTFLADNLARLRSRRRPVFDALDLTGLDEDERVRLGAGLEKLYRGGQALIEAEHHKSLSAFFGSLGDGPGEEERYRSALAAYEVAVEEMPGDRMARYLQGNALYGWWISLGLLELDRGDYRRAAEHFEKAREIDNPFRPDMAWTLLGKTLNRLGRYRHALSCLETALTKFPRSPTALAERGYALFHLGRVKSAVSDFHLAFDSPVQPETDGKLLAATKRAFQMERKGLLPEEPEPEDEVTSILEQLREGGAAGKEALVVRLRTIFDADPELVRVFLADDLARAEDANASPAEQRFALDIAVTVGDLETSIHLLRAGTPEIREQAADVLARVRKKPVVPALIGAMGDPDRDVREAAWAALFGLTGKQAKGFDPDAPKVIRDAALKDLRAWWKKVEPTWKF